MKCPTRIVTRPRGNERGSALLIVFVMAAILAIYLYREMPQTLFEAKRQKEEVLAERGHEYVRAVQLFYRKNRGQYPASFDQLENTNNTRFLRRRYVDPFTGKADWRLLHAGPGGILIDSKVTPSKVAGAAPGSTLGQSIAQEAGNTLSSSPSGSGISPSSGSDSGGVVVPAVPQRGPAVQATGSAASADPTVLPSSAQLDQDPGIPLLPSPGSPAADSTVGPGKPVGLGTQALNPASNQAGPTGSGSASSNVMQTLAPVLNSPTSAPLPTSGNSLGSAFGSSTSGQLNSGGLAGVASTAKGRTIKTIAKQTDYSLWEFYYDPSKDTSMGTGIAQTGGASLGGSQNPANTIQQNGASAISPSTNGTLSSQPGSSNGNSNSPAPVALPTPDQQPPQ